MAIQSLESEVVPPLKWAGGKRWLVPKLQTLWQPHRERCRLVEPFVGGLAVVLGLRPQSALLNDMNPHLIFFYRWLQRGLELRPFSSMMANNREAFGRNRDRFNALSSSGEPETAEASALFYYLNRTCYNGLCRFNKAGFYNVPFGRHKAISYKSSFREYVAALRGYTFETGDFSNLNVKATDFIYADPPYDVEFTSYSQVSFDWSDQVRLAQWLRNHPGPVVVSNQATPRILKLYRGLAFNVETVSAPRRISCTGDRDSVDEMIAVRNI